jgi:acetyl-CoA synthetase (ADP-forming) alpha subunit (EC 6.2.1.13)/branched-chain acyl-CoA synthetase (ADP-forming) alpha subunit (EC 6.2.1.-)
MDALFNPRSIAVIGASKTPGKIGHAILTNIVKYGFRGRVYPVNPKYDEIEDLKCYPTVLDIPDEIDLAIIVIPAEQVPKAVGEAGAKGAKVAVVISSGFKEAGRADLEESLLEYARKYNIRILGPNIFGLCYTPKRLNATFGPQDVIPGSIALVSQSGALGIALMGWTIVEKVGLSALISLGNKADIDDADLLEWLRGIL